MHLRTVRKGIWSIYEVCDQDGTSPLLSWRNELNPKYHGSFKGLLAIILQVASTTAGPTTLPVERSHEVDKNESIYEFIAGDLRLLWFYSEHQRKVIICGCQHIKKGQKVNKKLKKDIIRIKKEYSKSYNSGKIKYFDDGGNK